LSQAILAAFADDFDLDETMPCALEADSAAAWDARV
jgi:hypothetical protein